MNVLFLMDPLETVNFDKDTSLALMWGALELLIHSAESSWQVAMACNAVCLETFSALRHECGNARATTGTADTGLAVRNQRRGIDDILFRMLVIHGDGGCRGEKRRGHEEGNSRDYFQKRV